MALATRCSAPGRRLTAAAQIGAVLMGLLAAGAIAPGATAAPAAAPTPPCQATPKNDFIDRTPAAQRRLIPRDCAVADSNPLRFVWPLPSGASDDARWTLRIRDEAGRDVLSLTGLAPRAVLPRPLPAARYQWQVAYAAVGASPASISDWRRFEVRDGATAAVSLPTSAQLLDKLGRTSGSRLLPPDWTWARAVQTLKTGDMNQGLDALLSQADAALAAPSENLSTAASPAANAQWAERATNLLDVMRRSNRVAAQIELLALAWRLSNQDRFLQALKGRVAEVLSWDPDVATSEREQPQANRNAYLALSLAYDLAADALSADERARIAAVITKRLGAALQSQRSLDREPFRNFENEGIHTSLQALALIAGRAEFPQAAEQLDRAWTLFLTQPLVWSVSDGANASSVAYAWYDLRLAVRTAAFLRLAAGVDVLQLPPLRRMGDFLIAMTTPAGNHSNAYGDGLEANNLFQTYAGGEFRLYAALTGIPAYEWYWRQARDTPARAAQRLMPWHLLLSLTPLPATRPSAPTAAVLAFQDAGIVALHDDPSSAERSTLVFRASSYGSYSHGHADQNAFVLNQRGRDLLISSGYYPYYLSPHHAQVTRATRYKNAVTFDGGIGQAEPVSAPTTPGAPVRSMDTAGELLSITQGDDLSAATGDASLAYRGWDARAGRWVPLLSKATRTVVRLRRANVTLVFDWLESAQARRWEWNYHGVESFRVDNAELWVSNGPVQACIEHWGARGKLSTSSVFATPPERPYPSQYHARFTADTATKTTVMLTTIRPDCASRPLPVSMDQDARSGTIDVAGLRIRFARDQLTWTRSTNEAR